jgi:hypothetical protein
MFSFLDLIIAFIISLCFIGLFKVQKKFSPTNYFASSQLIVGSSISWRMVLLRFILVFIFGLLSYLIVRNETIILLGVLLGSFLIIWPTILSPFESYASIVKKLDVIIIYLSNFLFVITSVIIVYVSVRLFPIVSDYIATNKVDITWDIFLFLIFSITGFPGKEMLDRILENRITKNENDYYSYKDYGEEGITYGETEVSATREED